MAEWIRDALVRSHAVVLLSFLAALAIALGALAFAIARGVGLWRQVKRTGSSFGEAMAAFEERAARTERVLAEAQRSSEDLEAALARLRLSRARLGVLTGEVRRASARVRWLRALLPV